MEQNPKLSFGEINYKNIGVFKVITKNTLPVTYSDKFYEKIISYSEFSTLGYYNDIAVGAITARVEEIEGKQTLYIMTFGVLESYRRLHFGKSLDFQCFKGTQLLDEIIRRVLEFKQIRTIYLHMWEANEVGYKFYCKNGFEKTQYKRNYYTDIDPPHCYILTKRLYPDEDPPIQYSEQDCKGKQQQEEQQ